MDAELVFFAADRPEAVEAVAAPVFRQFDDGVAVGFAFGLPREVERFAAFEPRTDVQRVGKVGAGGGEGFVGFFHRAALEQGLVGAAAFGAVGKQDDARRVFVQPVQRSEVFGIQVLQFGAQPQAGEQGFAQEAAAGDDGQEVRFVGHNQVFVDVQDVFLKRHGFFFGGDGFAVVVNRAAGAECGVGGQRRAGFVEDVAV